MPEETLVCAQCQQPFTFTEEEQAQCVEQAFPPPTYCAECHRARKAAKEESRAGSRRGGHRRRR